MKPFVFCLSFVSLITPLAGQVLKPDAKNTYFSEMWNVYNTHRRISYLAPLVPTRENGNSGWPVLFEANISPYFTLFRGRDYGDFGYSHPQLKSLLVYFNPEMTLRMYREEPLGTKTKSLPVLPINFAPRVSIVKFFHKTLVENSVHRFKRYHFLELSAAHYSNGQENPHYLPGVVSASGDSIPNFTSGNFSTNYLRLVYTDGWIDADLNIFSWAPHVQLDGGAGSLFSYDRAQVRSYGKVRAGITLQFQSKKTRLFSKDRQKIGLTLDPGDKTQLRRDTARWDYFATWMARLSLESIVDRVDRYPSKDKRILAARLTMILHPLNWRNFGLMAECYFGRDFYNIRFYHGISQFKVGILADPDFYIPRNTY